MTAYTLFGQPASPSTLTVDTTAYTFGVQFQVDEACTLTAVWWWSPPGAGALLPTEIALFTVSGQALVHSESASWSGAAGSGWVRAAFTSPPSLSSGVAYKACVLGGGGDNWYGSTTHWWDTGPGAGGVTSGPLSAPGNAASDGGQDSFNVGASLTYPSSSFNAANYWVDAEVQPSAGPSAASSGTGVAALALSASASGSGARSGSGSGAVALSASSSGSSARAGTGTAVLSLAALATVPAQAQQPQTGSWWGLDTILKESRQEYDAYWSRPPLDCPFCGQPLTNAPSSKSGSGVELYCQYAGDHRYHYPEDREQPTRMDSGGLVSPFGR